MDFDSNFDTLPEIPDILMERLIAILEVDFSSVNEQQKSPPVVDTMIKYETSSSILFRNAENLSAEQELPSASLEALPPQHYQQLGMYERCTPKQFTSNVTVLTPSTKQSNKEIKSNINTTLQELLLSDRFPAPKTQTVQNQFTGEPSTTICSDCGRRFEKLAELNFHLMYRTASCEACEGKFCTKALRDAHSRSCHR